MSPPTTATPTWRNHNQGLLYFSAIFRNQGNSHKLFIDWLAARQNPRNQVLAHLSSSTINATPSTQRSLQSVLSSNTFRLQYNNHN